MTDNITEADTNEADTSEGMTRRTAVKAVGVAWGTPVILAAATAPAFSASVRNDPGINGWLLINYGTSNNFDAAFDSDPAGQDGATPDGTPYGLYINNPNLGAGGSAPGISDTLTDASITLWFRGTVDSWDYENENGQDTPNNGGHGTGWSAPTNIGSAVKPDNLTYVGYRFVYTGGFALQDGNTRVYLQDFGATAESVNSGDATFWVERSIKVNGVTKSFQRRNGERGALGNGFPGARAAESKSLTQAAHA